MSDACRSCTALSKMEPLSGVPYVYVGDHFVVDHAAGVARAGWLVIVTRRHAAALHELTADEWRELNALLPRVVTALHEVTGSEKEYVMQFAESAGFQHIHWHVVPVQAGDTLRGADVFQLLNSTQPLTAEDLAPISDRLRPLLDTGRG